MFTVHLRKNLLLLSPRIGALEELDENERVESLKLSNECGASFYPAYPWTWSFPAPNPPSSCILQMVFLHRAAVPENESVRGLAISFLV